MVDKKIWQMFEKLCRRYNKNPEEVVEDLIACLIAEAKEKKGIRYEYILGEKAKVMVHGEKDSFLVPITSVKGKVKNSEEVRVE